MIYEAKDNYGRYLEEFQVGDVYRHWPGKTITESDNNLFCLLTMNHNPLHLDANVMSEHQHGRILIAGPLVLSLAVGMSVSDTSGRAIANLEYEKVVHDAPVFRLRGQALEFGSGPDREILDREVHNRQKHIP